MNIFATSISAKLSALWLDDKRVNKMVLETAQLLCTSVILRGGDAPYRVTHINHPCAVWARISQDNFMWLVRHGQQLAEVYSSVYGRDHASLAVINEVSLLYKLLPKQEQTPFANCTPYKHIDDVHKAYQAYMCDKWNADEHPTWRGRGAPNWYKKFPI